MRVKHFKTPAEYLKAADPLLGSVIEKLTLKPLRLHKNYFQALVIEIINQQLSGRVADVIEKRFRELFVTPQNSTRRQANRNFPEPAAVLSMPDETMRSAGMSFAKISYIKNVARIAKEDTLNPRRLGKLSDEEVIAVLTAVKGIGRWTAQMFLMFTMGRPDVFSCGDLGLQKAMVRVYNLRKPPTPKRAEKISNPWRPHRTLASRYLWASLESSIKG